MQDGPARVQKEEKVMSHQAAYNARIKVLGENSEGRPHPQKTCREFIYDNIVCVRNIPANANSSLLTCMRIVQDEKLLRDSHLVADTLVGFVILNPACISEILSTLESLVINDSSMANAGEGVAIGLFEMCVLYDGYTKEVLRAMSGFRMQSYLSRQLLSEQGAGRLTTAITGFVRNAWLTNQDSVTEPALHVHYFLRMMERVVDKQIVDLKLTAEQARKPRNLLLAVVKEVHDRNAIEMPLRRSLEMNTAYTKTFSSENESLYQKYFEQRVPRPL
jgi:hypothetical protein